jgi:hypothetical protein
MDDMLPDIDFRAINSGVVTDGYTLPIVDFVLSSLAGCKFFAKMELRYGYWQFLVRQSERKFLAFYLKGKFFQYRAVSHNGVCAKLISRSAMHVPSFFLSLLMRCVGQFGRRDRLREYLGRVFGSTSREVPDFPFRELVPEAREVRLLRPGDLDLGPCGHGSGPSFSPWAN